MGNENQLMEDIMLGSEEEERSYSNVSEQRLTEWFKQGGHLRKTSFSNYNPDDVTVLPGAKITAHSTSMF